MSWYPLVNTEYDALILAAATSAGTDPALVKAHIARESDFDPRALASDPNGTTQSYGLGQLEVATAQGLGWTGGVPTDADRANLTGLYDPETNIGFAAQLIARNLARAQTVDDAIAAYNEGWSLIFPGKAPREADGTYVDQPYVDDVNTAWGQYQADFPGAPVATAGHGGFIDFTVMAGIVVIGILLAVAGVL